MRLDTGEWREFRIGDLFELQKGTRLTKANMLEGDIRFVSAANINNGITAHVGNNDHVHSEGTITVCYNGNGGTGKAFYQDSPYWASDDVHVLYPKFHLPEEFGDVEWTGLNAPVGLFLATAIEKVGRQKYGFTNKWKLEYMREDKIKLPIDADEKPDWAYMNNFMTHVFSNISDEESCISSFANEPSLINSSSWTAFRIGEILPTIVKPKVLHQREVSEDPNGIPYVVRSKFGNGIKCRVRKDKAMEPSPAGVISFGSENSTFFYQEEEFVSGRDIYYIDTRHLSRGSCLFLATCLQTITDKYAYNYGLFPELLREETIKLPAAVSGNPDWDFMDAYMLNALSNADKKIDSLSEVAQ